MAGRQDLMVAIKLAAAEQAIMELLMAVRSLAGDGGDWVGEDAEPAVAPSFMTSPDRL